MPRKLGHVAFHAPDVKGTVKFYCDMLGFKVSDWRSDFFAFLRCSRDHHTINLLQADHANIHHIAFELRDEAEINRACDFLARKNVKLFWGPIRHVIGHNIAIYHRNPDGITVEFFTDLDVMHDEELGYFEPRPWHQDRPQRPRSGATTRPRTIGAPGTRTTCRGRRSEHHTLGIFASATTLVHLATSSATCALKPSGVVGRVSLPRPRSRSITAGSARIARSSALTLAHERRRQAGRPGDPRLAADHVGKDQPAEAAALRARAVVGGQPVAAVEADERAAIRLEEHRDAVVVLDLPAEALRVELLGPVHVTDAEEDRAHLCVHALPPFLLGTFPLTATLGAARGLALLDS